MLWIALVVTIVHWALSLRLLESNMSGGYTHPLDGRLRSMN